jgi:hypothetical protein
MIYLFAILWLLALVYTLRKRSRQISVIKTKIKERYEQKSKEDKGEKAEEKDSESDPA